MGSQPGPRPTKGGQTEAGGLEQDGLEGNSSAWYFFPGVEERTSVTTIPR